MGNRMKGMFLDEINTQYEMLETKEQCCPTVTPLWLENIEWLISEVRLLVKENKVLYARIDCLKVRKL